MHYNITDETGPTTIADTYQAAQQQVIHRWGGRAKDLDWDESDPQVTRINLAGREVATIEYADAIG